jgi:broad specificity phosphatase PhoE
MTRIILVRHGQTPWNKDKIFRGSRDIPLNDTGREEARLAGEWLKGETIHAAYCSPLSRARDTGALTSEKKDNLSFNPAEAVVMLSYRQCFLYFTLLSPSHQELFCNVP